jgi:hypothetical protein
MPLAVARVSKLGNGTRSQKIIQGAPQLWLGRMVGHADRYRVIGPDVHLDIGCLTWG